MAQSILKVTTSFTDDTTREHELGPFKPTASVLTNVKTNIATFNTNVGSLSGIYISEGGAECTGITAASITTTEETEINLNV